MPQFFIRTINSKLSSSDEGAEYSSPELAMTTGVRSAIAIAADEINGSERSTAIEVSVLLEDGTELLRSVVSVSVSALLVVTSPNRGGHAAS